MIDIDNVLEMLLISSFDKKKDTLLFHSCVRISYSYSGLKNYTKACINAFIQLCKQETIIEIIMSNISV